MKHEIYSCLKMLESLQQRINYTCKIGEWGAALALTNEYTRIWELLEKYLTNEQLQFIPKRINWNISFSSDRIKRACILNLNPLCATAIAYLRSLEMDFDKESRQKELDLESREKEIAFKERLLNKSLDAIKAFPEWQRSKIVEETKKSHREIEKHSR